MSFEVSGPVWFRFRVVPTRGLAWLLGGDFVPGRPRKFPEPSPGGGNPLELAAPCPYLQAVTIPPGDDERFEHIPWEQMASNGNRSKLALYGLAGAVLVAGLTAAIVRGLGSPAEPGSPATTTLSVTPATTAGTTAISSPGTATSATMPDEPPQIWSEADLLAFPTATLAAEAAAVAEWLASDYFTIDGGTQVGDDLRTVLPEGSAVPTGPSGSRSFVEWARAVSVEEPAPGHFEVLVVVRRLGATDGESYRRVAPIGVVVTLSWTEEGWSVTDLPLLAEAPTLVQAPAWSQSEVPAEIVAAVAATTGGVVVTGTPVAGTWRLVVQIDDASGVSWPMVVWSDATGNLIEAAQSVEP
jgi:hypothetical protein